MHRGKDVLSNSKLQAQQNTPSKGTQSHFKVVLLKVEFHSRFPQMISDAAVRVLRGVRLQGENDKKSEFYLLALIK